MADRNKEALLEVRCKFSHFDYTPDILNYFIYIEVFFNIYIIQEQ